MPLSGEEMLRLYQRAGRKVLSQKDSHVKIGRGSLREIIPLHAELKKGIERALLKRLKSEGGPV